VAGQIERGLAGRLVIVCNSQDGGTFGQLLNTVTFTSFG
jgi:hypothetical protein